MLKTKLLLCLLSTAIYATGCAEALDSSQVEDENAESRPSRSRSLGLRTDANGDPINVFDLVDGGDNGDGGADDDGGANKTECQVRITTCVGGSCSTQQLFGHLSNTERGCNVNGTVYKDTGWECANGVCRKTSYNYTLN